MKHEMVEEKGLDAAVADRIGGYVQYHGNLGQFCCSFIVVVVVAALLLAFRYV